jgi:hypothetical protein
MKASYLSVCAAAAVLAFANRAEAADVAFINGGDFNTATNWSDGNLPGAIADDIHFVQDTLTATYASGTVSMGKLIISDSSPGTLQMSGGDLTVGGGNESFAIGRSLNGDGLVELTGNAVLRTAAGDSSFVGQRDKGVLRIGAGASVLSPNSVWRVGQFGPVIDNGLEGEGLLDVAGVFEAGLMFLGVDDGTGILRVRDSGSVSLSSNLQPNVNTFFPNRLSLIEMIGSSASLTANSLESANGSSENRNRYLFQADSGGVSPITLRDAVNIDNNRVDVDLTNYTAAPNDVLTLFDAAPDRVFGTLGEVNILGDDPALWRVAVNSGLGDIQLLRIPEPSAVLLLALAALAPAAWRQR